MALQSPLTLVQSTSKPVQVVTADAQYTPAFEEAAGVPVGATVGGSDGAVEVDGPVGAGLGCMHP